MARAAVAAHGSLTALRDCKAHRVRMMIMIDCDWPWWIRFAAAMVSSYFREMRLRTERNDPPCTLFYTYQPAGLKNGSPLAPNGPKAPH